jgi:hypothetical protein
MADALVQQNPAAFFRERLRDAFAEQRVEPSEAAEAYLVWLLERFARGDDLLDRPLAIAYLESRGDSPATRYAKLKQVGDTALFVTGVFLESVEATTVGVDYYVAIGGTAYRDLSRLGGFGSPRDPGDLFAELAARFADFVRVLGEIDLQSGRGDQHTITIYRRWLATRGGRDAERLVRRGIIPFAPSRSMIQ